jgi:hypothetical protein
MWNILVMQCEIPRESEIFVKIGRVLEAFTGISNHQML